jgi:chromosomal replication initiator protein
LGKQLTRGKKQELSQVRSASLLVVEDVEQMVGSVSAHRHFQSLLDDRTATRQPTLVTSTSAPGLLSQLPPMLRNRLAGGLVVGLARPEYAPRAAIVRSLAHSHDLTMTHRAVELIARRLDRSITDLVHAVEGLARQPTRSNMVSRIDHSCAQRYLTARQRANGPTLRRIVSKAARAYGLTDVDLKGRSRRRSVATARGVAMYLAWKRGGFSLQQIGKYLGNRDHTTVLHGCRKIDLLLPQDAAIQEAVAGLEHLWRPTTPPPGRAKDVDQRRSTRGRTST